MAAGGSTRIVVLALLATKVRPGDLEVDVASLMRKLNEVENEVRAAYPEVAYHFVEPDFLV